MYFLNFLYLAGPYPVNVLQMCTLFEYKISPGENLPRNSNRPVFHTI